MSEHSKSDDTLAAKVEPDKRLASAIAEIEKWRDKCSRLLRERDAKLRIARIVQRGDVDVVLQVVAIHETPDGVYVEVR